jgi:hypothetical protein
MPNVRVDVRRHEGRDRGVMRREAQPEGPHKGLDVVEGLVYRRVEQLR